MVEGWAAVGLEVEGLATAAWEEVQAMGEDSADSAAEGGSGAGSAALAVSAAAAERVPGTSPCQWR